MLSRTIALLLLSAGLVATNAMAQTSGPAIRIKQSKREVVVDADGRTTLTNTSQVQVLTAAAATQLAQAPVRFDASLEEIEILEAYTLKPDGRKLPVDPANIITQKAPQANPLIPLYFDQEQKIVIFPNVEAGDSLVMTYKSTLKKSPLPGQFSFANYFGRTVVADDSSYSVTVPKSMHVNVASTELTPEVLAHGDTTTYHWSFSNATPQAAPVSLVVDPDKGPHFIVSTFKDYDTVGHVYAGLIASKVAVTPEIQKQADSLTTGVSDRREQARILYDWVASHVRYVGLELGSGSIIPHDPNWTLNNAFGDCKDQAVLLSSLLKAKGIPSELALIHAGNRFKFTDLPTVSDFNHVIVWLPDWKIYADTTAGAVAFGTLPQPDYGKPVVHLVASGAARHQTPVMPPDLVNSTYKVHAVQNADGRFDVHVSSAATGPWAAGLRRVADGIQTVGPVAAAAGLLKSHNFPNATGNFDPISVNNTTAGSFTISGVFHAAKPPAGGNVLNLTRGLMIFSRAGDGLMGPLNNTTITEADETPCYSGRQVEDIDFEFANGDHITKLPSDTHIKTDNISYDTHWTQEGNKLALHREFVAHVSEPTCSGRLRRETADALAKIRSDYAQQALIAERDRPKQD